MRPTRACLCVPVTEGETQDNARALGGCGTHLQIASQLGSSRAHAPQPQAVAVIGRNTASVILDLRAENAEFDAEPDRGASRLGMTRDVVDRFLADQVELAPLSASVGSPDRSGSRWSS